MIQKLNFAFFVILLSAYACKKKSEGDCNLSIDNDIVTCEADDTSSSVSGFTTILYNGSSQVKSEGNFTNGVRTGFWKYYYSNGELMKEGSYTDGEADGYWNVYYENGNIQSQGHFDNCKRNGFWQYYFEEEDYAIQYSGNYEKDEKVGTWKSFNLAGAEEEIHECN